MHEKKSWNKFVSFSRVAAFSMYLLKPQSSLVTVGQMCDNLSFFPSHSLLCPSLFSLRIYSRLDDKICSRVPRSKMVERKLYQCLWNMYAYLSIPWKYVQCYKLILSIHNLIPVEHMHALAIQKPCQRKSPSIRAYSDRTNLRQPHTAWHIRS